MTCYNPGRNIWNKTDKSDNINQDKKADIYVCGFFKLLLQKFNFWKGEWALGCVSSLI